MLANTIYEHLKEFSNKKIKGLVEPAVIIQPDFTVSQVINKISKNDSYDAYCLVGKSVMATNIRSLLEGKDIVDMKISPFLYSIPSITGKDTIQRASNILSHYRMRGVPVLEGKKIIGAIYAEKILKLISSKDHKWITANIIYTQNPITISADDSLSSARKLMTSKRIDHLPVINKGSINQVLTSTHLLHTINPQESLGRKSKGMKKNSKTRV